MNKYFAILIIILAIISSNSTKAAKLKRVVFSPQWMPQAQFAGYYMAKERGFYKESGLDVVFLHADPEHSAIDYLKQGKANFATMFLSSAIKQKAMGLNIVNIAQISQHSAIVIVAKKDKGITKLSDLNGKRLGLWHSSFQEIPKAYLKQNNISLKIVPIASGINMFLRDGVDAVTAMWYNEYHSILNKGINPGELAVFHLSQSDLDIPEDGIYCLSEFRKKNLDTCKKFISASVKGWQYAFNHKKETIAIVMKKMKAIHRPTNYSQQRWMLDQIAKLFSNNGKISLELTPKIYYKTANILKQEGDLEQVPNYQQFYQPVNNVQK